MPRVVSVKEGRVIKHSPTKAQHRSTDGQVHRSTGGTGYKDGPVSSTEVPVTHTYGIP